MKEHEVIYEGRERTRAEHLASALATVIGSAKLITRAQHGDPSESNGNARCAASWLKVAAAELEALLKDRK